MNITIQILQIIFYSVGILFMLTFIFIGIWSFIVFLKLHKLKKSQLSVLTKINYSLSQTNKNPNSDLDLDNHCESECLNNTETTTNSLENEVNF